MHKKIVFFLTLFFFAQANAQMSIHIKDNNKENGIILKLTSKGQELAASNPLLFNPIIAKWGIYTINKVDLTQFNKINSDFENQIISKNKNHKLTQRGTPNDPQLNNQWELPLLGTNKVWDTNQGGVTIKGDTIVIAVIDGGVDFKNPDLKNNIWVNKNEIDGDNIDNDNNGYIDDKHGWNTYQDNGDILDSMNERGDHGTPVASIIAAKGNNDTGTAGIVWHSKIMSVVGGGFEDDALKAYNYILIQKKLWLSSNKTKGANVVATNTSWGIDDKFMSDAPLWCAMYDSLGKYGIMNVSAVANANKNVDVTGDLPTNCKSNYLITVTATSKADVLYNNSAFGKKTVDIGAPGQKIFAGSNYINFKTFGSWTRSNSGTSFACPQVVGAFAMLMSIACDSFLNLYTEHPDSALLIIKTMILESGKELTSLNNKTVSGKRLDIFAASQKIKKWCDNTNGNSRIYNNLTFQLYPNPVNNELIISPKKNNKYTVVITNSIGQMVISKKAHSNTSINFTQLHKGLYILNIITNKGKSQYKIIKQ